MFNGILFKERHIYIILTYANFMQPFRHIISINPNTEKSYIILQRLSPEHAARGVAQQLPWRASGDSRLARGRSRVRVSALAGALRGLFFLHTPFLLPSSFFAPSPPPHGSVGLYTLMQKKYFKIGWLFLGHISFYIFIIIQNRLFSNTKCHLRPFYIYMALFFNTSDCKHLSPGTYRRNCYINDTLFTTYVLNAESSVRCMNFIWKLNKSL